MNFFHIFHPFHMEQRFFLFQLPQTLKHSMAVTPFRQFHPVSKYRSQHRRSGGFLSSKSFSRIRFGQPCYSTDHAGRHLLKRFIFSSRVHPQFVCFFLPGIFLIISSGKHSLHLKFAPGNLHMRETFSLTVSGNLKDLGTESFRIQRYLQVLLHSFQKPLYSGHFQSRTEIAGKHLPLPNQFTYFFLVNFSRLQILLHQFLTAQSQTFQEFLRISALSEIHTVFIQPGF